MVEHFFSYGGLPHLLLVVELRRRGAPAQQAALEPAQVEVLRRLQAWRRKEAQGAGVPAYTLFTDAQAHALARHAPASLAALRRVKGFGDKRIARWGEAILAVLRGPGG